MWRFHVLLDDEQQGQLETLRHGLKARNFGETVRRILRWLVSRPDLWSDIP